MPTSQQLAAWAGQLPESHSFDLLSPSSSKLPRRSIGLRPGQLSAPILWRSLGMSGTGREAVWISVTYIDHVPLSALIGIEPRKDAVLSNLRGFAAGVQANHMLLWGARGAGKNSLTSGVHAYVTEEAKGRLALVEVAQEHIGTLGKLLQQLATVDRCFLLFCDDLSFDEGEAGYESLRATLDVGTRACPKNILLAVTSNRRHLLRRDMVENERWTAIHANEAVEEKVSLADRFGLSLGFYNAAQDDYMAMAKDHLGKQASCMDEEEVTRASDNWARQRGARSGRVAVQFAGT